MYKIELQAEELSFVMWRACLFCAFKHSSTVQVKPKIKPTFCFE